MQLEKNVAANSLSVLISLIRVFLIGTGVLFVFFFLTIADSLQTVMVIVLGAIALAPFGLAFLLSAAKPLLVYKAAGATTRLVYTLHSVEEWIGENFDRINASFGESDEDILRRIGDASAITEKMIIEKANNASELSDVALNLTIKNLTTLKFAVAKHAGFEPNKTYNYLVYLDKKSDAELGAHVEVALEYFDELRV